MRAAYIWDWIARLANLRYAFAGSFAAILKDATMQVHDIEIVLEPEVTRNNFERLTRILNFPGIKPYVKVTKSNHNMVIIRENEGVAFQFATLGTDGYPNMFIYPFDSHFPRAQHYGYEANIQYCYLKYPIGWIVPVLRSRQLIEQRLYRFDPQDNENVKRRNIRDIYEIKTLLRSARIQREYQFHSSVTALFQHRVIEWIAYAERNFIGTTEDEINAWNALGLSLTRENISKQFRRERNVVLHVQH